MSEGVIFLVALGLHVLHYLDHCPLQLPESSLCLRIFHEPELRALLPGRHDVLDVGGQERHFLNVPSAPLIGHLHDGLIRFPYLASLSAFTRRSKHDALELCGPQSCARRTYLHPFVSMNNL